MQALGFIGWKMGEDLGRVFGADQFFDSVSVYFVGCFYLSKNILWQSELWAGAMRVQ